MLQFQEELTQLYLRSGLKPNYDFDNQMSESLLTSIANEIGMMDESLQSFRNRWATYQQAVQTYIATDDSLLNRVAEIQQLQQTVTQSLANLHQQYDQIESFNRAEVFMFGQDSIYSSMYRQATGFSLSSKLAAQLEKIKASEQLLFTDVQTQYTNAKQVATDITQLGARMDRLESKFVELRVISEKIQQAEYKPLLERVKDWLMGLAAVSVVMMFANMIITRLNSLKNMRAQAQKMKNMMGGGQEYPTI